MGKVNKTVRTSPQQSLAEISYYFKNVWCQLRSVITRASAWWRASAGRSSRRSQLAQPTQSGPPPTPGPAPGSGGWSSQPAGAVFSMPSSRLDTSRAPPGFFMRLIIIILSAELCLLAPSSPTATQSGGAST